MGQEFTQDDEADTTPATLQPATTAEGRTRVNVAILGTGFSGLGMAIRLKQAGHDDFVVLEKASEIGGTWRDNTYPGCACDVPSHLYSFSFALNPDWSRAYSPQPEIRAYLRQCAERFGILPHIRWETLVAEARWDDAAQCWRLNTSQGPLVADILIMGNGPLSEPSLPAIPGIADFAGKLFHSAQWDHAHDLTGERVAVIGTGASAIQIVPQIQPRVSQLLLFQRTPPWIVPRLDHPIAPWQQDLYRKLPLAQRAVRTLIYWQRELGALAMVYRPQMLKSAEKVAMKHLAAQVPDPELRARLTPNYRMGCKRILPSDTFYPALSQPNVALITERIREVRPHSIITADGQARAVDTIICATGFHVTDTQNATSVFGRDGRSLAALWGASPSAYYGTAVAGFPNLFLLIGPNTGLGHTSMVLMIEAQITYILDALRTMQYRNARTLEVQPAAYKAYNAEIDQRMAGTVWSSGCASWYLDANGRNSTLWPGFTFAFRRRLRHFDPEHYELVMGQRTSSGESLS